MGAPPALMLPNARSASPITLSALTKNLKLDPVKVSSVLLNSLADNFF